MISNASHPVAVYRLHGPKNGKSGLNRWGQGWYIQFVLHLIVDAVAAQPRA